MTFVFNRRSMAALPRSVSLALAPVLVLMAEPGAAAAGQGGIGVVNAVAGPAVPAGTPIAVVAGEFTDLNTRLQDVVERALVDRGFTVTRNAPLILSFDVEISSETSDIQHRGGGNIVGSGEPGVDDSPYAERPWQDGGGEVGREQPEIEDPQVRIPFGGGGNEGGARHSLSFTLGRNGRPPIWQGSVIATLPTPDPFQAAQEMVPVLTEYIGRTARGEQVTID